MFNGASKNRSSGIDADQARSFNIQNGNESDMQNLEGADSSDRAVRAIWRARPFGIKDCSIAVLFPPFTAYFTKVVQA